MRYLQARAPIFNLEEELPRWMGLLGLGGLIALCLAIVVTHGFSARSIVVVVLVLAAWLATDAARVLPRFLHVAVVVGGVAALLAQPVSFDLSPMLLVFLCAEVGVELPTSQSLTVLVVSVGVPVAWELDGRFYGAWIWALGIFLSWVGGAGLRHELRLVAQLRAAQARLAEQAASEERRRIAREIHDVAAHSLSVTMLHLSAARLALSRKEYDEVRDALTEAERMGRQSMADVRHTVGLLSPGGSGTAAPLPGAADIATLVEEYRSAGLDVRLALSGDPSVLSSGAGLGLYRIIQESLANVAKHDPTALAEVQFEVDGTRCRLVVADRGGVGARQRDGESQGRGLPGMRERAELLGGTFQAGPDRDGWIVRVNVPLKRSVS